MSTTILLVDDHPVFRQGLRHLLAKEKGLKVVGEANDGQMAIDQVQREKPDLVIMDINMPNLDGINATRKILTEFPGTKIVALSVHSGKQLVRDMIQSGASGYILKESIPEEMIAGIRTVLAGDVYLSKSISNILVSDYKTLISESESDPNDPTLPILYTKLHRPPISAAIIHSVRLIELLEIGAEYPLSLIAAPAGYGKSILVSQWLEVSESPSGWVSLDESDNDLWVFLSYVIEAIQTAFPGHDLQTRSLLGSINLPSLKVTARYLLNDLETLPKHFILVIDDYHHIRSAAVHNLLMELLVHPSPLMHLVLITRWDPPLPLTSLRNRGMLTEISAKDLRFSASETRSYLERFLRITISDQTAQVMEEKMEGWVTGLHLAALSIRNEADQDRLTAELLETSQSVREYLIQEVLSQVPPHFNRYLQDTAVLGRFCAALCEALAQEDSDPNHTEADATARAVIDSMAGLAFAYQAIGKPENAIAAVTGLREFGDSIQDPTCSPIADACHARVSILQHEQAPAADFLRRSSPPVENMVWWIEIPAVTYCRALLAEGSDVNLQDAAMRLQKILQVNLTNHNILHSIRTLALLAAVYQKQRRIDEALAAVERSLSLTDSADIIQPFIELGPPMANLLKRLREKNVSVAYIEKLLAAFDGDKAKALTDATDPDAPSSPLPGSRSPIPHLAQSPRSPAFDRAADESRNGDPGTSEAAAAVQGDRRKIVYHNRDRQIPPEKYLSEARYRQPPAGGREGEETWDFLTRDRGTG